MNSAVLTSCGLQDSCPLRWLSLYVFLVLPCFVHPSTESTVHMSANWTGATSLLSLNVLTWLLAVLLALPLSTGYAVMHGLHPHTCARSAKKLFTYFSSGQPQASLTKIAMCSRFYCDCFLVLCIYISDQKYSLINQITIHFNKTGSDPELMHISRLTLSWNSSIL